MALTLTTYNDSGIKIVTPEPLAGDGGQALTDNFQIIGDHIQGSGSQHTVSINTRASGTGTLTPSNRQQVFTNTGSIEQVSFTLPTASEGIQLSFVVDNASGIVINVANTGDKIQVGSSASVSGGNISATGLGTAVSLLAINSNKWVSVAHIGIWTTGSG